MTQINDAKPEPKQPEMTDEQLFTAIMQFLVSGVYSLSGQQAVQFNLVLANVQQRLSAIQAEKEEKVANGAPNKPAGPEADRVGTPAKS